MKRLGIILIVLIGVLALSIPFITREKVNQVTISDEFKQLDIKVTNAKVEIIPIDGEKADIQLLDKKNDYTLHTNMHGDELEVEVKSVKFFRWFSFNLFSSFSVPTLTIYLPERVYDMVQVESDNGLVNIDDLEIHETKVETDNGEINLRNIHGKEIYTKTDNGRIKLDHVEGNIVGKTDNGQISVITESLDKNIDLKTDNGIIEITTEKEPTNNTFDLKTDNGRITVFGSSSYDTVIGEGKYLIKLKTDNGFITID